MYITYSHVENLPLRAVFHLHFVCAVGYVYIITSLVSATLTEFSLMLKSIIH